MQKSTERIQTERGILTEAWYILKDHVGIEKRNYAEQGVADEWKALINRCKNLYETNGTQAQENLAQAVALAIMNYYGTLSKQNRGD